VSHARPPDPADVRRLFTRFILLVVLPAVGLVSFGVVAISNERAAVEQRFQQEYVGRLRVLGGHLAVTMEVAGRLSQPMPLLPSPAVKFDFALDSRGIVASRHLDADTSLALAASMRAGAPPPGGASVVPVASGPARGLYALVAAEGGELRGLAFNEAGLAAAVEAEGRLRFPSDSARFTLVGPREDAAPSSNPMRRLLDELTSAKDEPGTLSLPLPAPLAEWRILAKLPTDDTIRVALWRNRTIYLVTLALFYALITIGVVVTLRGIWREVRLSRLKTDFVSNISHELRTPLTSIRMFAETLKMGRATTKEEQDACIDFIMKESERLGQLAERTLDWARIEAGRRSFDFERCAPAKLVGDTLETFLSLATLPRADLTVTIDEELPDIAVDPSAFAQVLLNLLENAVKYTPLVKRIAVRVRRQRGKVLVQVEDNGIGIAKKDMKRIFDRFYRADDLLARRTEGTGLGLSIARRVVAAHGGRILVVSRVGTGSTFTVELPALKAKPAPAAAVESAS
jgi:two-component system phosphate regulon sensor histidine kinase PhoR